MARIRKIFLYLFLIFVIISLIKNIFDYQKKYQFYLGFKNSLEKEKKENLSLKTEYLKKTDPAELEKTIRNRLNLTRPDEAVVIIPEPSPTPIIIIPTPIPNWRQWWMVYFK